MHIYIYIDLCLYIYRHDIIFDFVHEKSHDTENYTGKVVEFALGNYLNGLLCFFICK